LEHAVNHIDQLPSNSLSTADDARREELIKRYIELNPNKPGRAEARIANALVPVWALVSYLPAVNGDLEQVAEDYEIPIEAVEAALAFYDRHRAIIDDRIRANEYRRA